ncbi:MAG: helix-turn-helix transcriptional regulator [Rhizobiaceae bacterium]|nr:helix-turn-helix transcriptional regulator [Rhizobiaceae bacterium]
MDGMRIKAAVDDITAAALLGQGWTSALAGFARAAGARHAVVMRNTPQRVVTSLSNEEARDAIAEYMTGRIPPNTRYARVDTRRSRGFRVDHDDYSPEDLAADPYYQEFLRPKGVFWHANAMIFPGRDEYVELSLKRGVELGPYQPDEIAVLNRFLEDLTASARIATRVLDAEARGMRDALTKGGGFAIEIDRRGQVLRGHDALDVPPDSSPLHVRGHRLIAGGRWAQQAVDRAIAQAVSRPGRTGVVPLEGPAGHRCLLQVHPVPGAARDVFLSAQAIAVLIEGRPAATSASRDLIRDAFGLTAREADVAALLAEGLGIPAIAARLNIRPGTARPYLRSVFAKTGTRGQLDLVALLSRLGN